MNQNFKLRYDELREGNPAQRQAVADGAQGLSQNYYPTESNVRNVCFVWPDGKRIFLNYGYLVSGEYWPEENKIILAFTSHNLTLTGVNLEILFYEFMQHLPKQVICMDERYNSIADNERAIVNVIQILSNSNYA